MNYAALFLHRVFLLSERRLPAPSLLSSLLPCLPPLPSPRRAAAFLPLHLFVSCESSSGCECQKQRAAPAEEGGEEETNTRVRVQTDAQTPVAPDSFTFDGQEEVGAGDDASLPLRWKG